MPPPPPEPADEPSFDDLMSAAADEAAAQTYDAAPLPPVPPPPVPAQSRPGGARGTVVPPGFAAKSRPAKAASKKGGFGHVNAGVVGGVLTMVAAVAWFAVGMMFLNRIFFYPPVMFIIGLVAVFKGMAGG